MSKRPAPAPDDDTLVDSDRERQRQKLSSSSPPPPSPAEKAPLLSSPSPPTLSPPTAADWKLHHKLQEDVFARAEEHRIEIVRAELERQKPRRALLEDLPVRVAAIRDRMEELQQEALAIQTEYTDSNAEYDRGQLQEDQWVLEHESFMHRFTLWMAEILPHHVSRYLVDLHESTLSQLGTTIEEVARSKLLEGLFSSEELTTDRASRLDKEIEELREDAKIVEDDQAPYLRRLDPQLLLDVDSSAWSFANLPFPTLIPYSPEVIDRFVSPATYSSTQAYLNFRRLITKILTISAYARVRFQVSAAVRFKKLQDINTQILGLSQELTHESRDLEWDRFDAESKLRELDDHLGTRTPIFQDLILDLIILSKGP